MRDANMQRSIALILLPLSLAACDKGQDTSAKGASQTSAGMATADETVVPSFDCATAESDATKLVCSDADLAAMDRELARLYGLAIGGPDLLPERKAELESMERGWVRGRDDCWKADDKRRCVMTEYAMRIHELRQGYADSRSRDSEGASTGPVAIACDGLGFGVSATFIQTDRGAVYLQWKDDGIALAHVTSGSGAKYEGVSRDGKSAALFTKGDDAMLTLPGEQERSCRIEEIG